MKSIKIFLYSIWYGVHFERGYKYERIKHQNLDILELHHKVMIGLGWEKCSDISAGFKYAYIWYRQKK
jgi:hypothetical protein